MKNSILIPVALAIAASPTFATTILTSDGNGADSYVRQGQPTNNFGATGNIVVKGGNGSTTRKIYLRFDLSAVSEAVTEAILTLTVTSNNSGGPTPMPGETFNVDIFGLTNESLDNWVEGDNGTDDSPLNEITYNNAPANLSPSNEFDGDALLLGTLNVPGTPTGESVTFSEPALAEFLNSDTNGLVTILMRRQQGGRSNLAFSSKEGDFIPQLDLVFGSPVNLAVSDIAYDPSTDAVSLTWSNTDAAAYTVKYSNDLISWEETLADQLSAGSDENPGDPDTITVTFDLSDIDPKDRIFFRVEED